MLVTHWEHFYVQILGECCTVFLKYFLRIARYWGEQEFENEFVYCSHMDRGLGEARKIEPQPQHGCKGWYERWRYERMIRKVEK